MKIILIKEVKPYINPNTGQKLRKGLFQCVCGNKFETCMSSIKSGNTKSCGCHQKRASSEVNTKHGNSHHPLYRVWIDMRGRCYNKNIKQYKNYGGRGVAICDEWSNNFKMFYDWAIKNGWERGLQIDRIDNDGNYKPLNCRFITQIENVRNSRVTKLTLEQVQEIRNTKLLIPNLTQKEIAKTYDITPQAVGSILNNRRWVV